MSRQGSLQLDFAYLYLYFKNWIMLSLYRVGQKRVCSYLALSCSFSILARVCNNNCHRGQLRRATDPMPRRVPESETDCSFLPQTDLTADKTVSLNLRGRIHSECCQAGTDRGVGRGGRSEKCDKEEDLNQLDKGRPL